MILSSTFCFTIKDNGVIYCNAAISCSRNIHNNNLRVLKMSCIRLFKTTCPVYSGKKHSHSERKILVTLISILILTLSTSILASKAAKEATIDFKQIAHRYVYDNYDLKAYQIPMRDGKKLFTQVYTPKDKSQDYPILLSRTPYRIFMHRGGIEGTFGLLGPGPGFIEEGYIFVVQDMRGRFLSEGNFVVMRPNTADWNDPNQTDESTDAYDTIDWLLENVNHNNGKVGTFGISYPGTTAALSLVNAHSALTAVVIEAPMAETFLGDDYNHNGAQQLLYPFMWLNNIGLSKREGPTAEPQRPIGCTDLKENYYSFFLKMGPISNMNKMCFKNKIEFWNDMMEHDTYDEFWKVRSIGRYMKGIKKPATLVVGSWFDDQDLYGTLATYQAIERQNPGSSNNLVMGLWQHAKWWEQPTEWGKLDIPAIETKNYYQDQILLPYFNFHLKGKGKLNLPEATVFESGSRLWKEYAEWPIKTTDQKQLFLGSNGRLLNHKASDSDKYDQFISDPANPVPEVIETEIFGWTSSIMHYDQRFAYKREDVLTYEEDILEEDITVSGPVEVELYVSTSGTDADWIVKLIDVYPNNKSELSNYQMLVRGDIMRGKFRNSFEKPEPFVSGKITLVKFSLPDINHTFRKGHRLMVQIQSSWFPYFDRNPQKFMNIKKATTEDFQKATHRVYFSKEYPSHIRLNIQPASLQEK